MPPIPLRRSLALGLGAVVLTLAAPAGAAELVAEGEASRVYGQAAPQAERTPVDQGPFRRLRLRFRDAEQPPSGWSTVYRGGEAHPQRALTNDRPRPLPARGPRAGAREHPRR